jgi:hypothetical protein
LLLGLLQARVKVTKPRVVDMRRAAAAAVHGFGRGAGTGWVGGGTVGGRRDGLGSGGGWFVRRRCCLGARRCMFGCGRRRRFGAGAAPVWVTAAPRGCGATAAAGLGAHGWRGCGGDAAESGWLHDRRAGGAAVDCRGGPPARAGGERGGLAWWRRWRGPGGGRARVGEGGGTHASGAARGGAAGSAAGAEVRGCGRCGRCGGAGLGRLGRGRASWLLARTGDRPSVGAGR